MIGSVGESRAANQDPTAGSKKASRHMSTRGKRDSTGSASAKALVA